MKETIEFVLNEKRQQEIEKLTKEGYCYRCIYCNRVSKQLRQEPYEDGHDGRFIDMCSCGSDLFQKLEKTTCLDAKIAPYNNTLVFKEHHAKYCKCKEGAIWTGDCETECHAEFISLERDNDKEMFKCLKSGLTLIILKSTEEELKNPDELGSSFLRIPSE